MPFFSVGEKVIVRHDIQTGMDYKMEDPCEGWIVVSEMASYKGKVLTIKKASKAGYRCRECDEWWWSDEMFEEYLHRNDCCAEYGDFEPAPVGDLMAMIYGT